MAKQPITVIHSDSKIETFYTLFPLLVSPYSHLIRFVHVQSKEARLAEGECAILVRVFKGNKLINEDIGYKREYIRQIKQRFNRVIMLDDGDGSDSLHFEYMDLVDLYYKGKLLKDKSLYLQPMYGRQYFTNYYKEKYAVQDEKEKMRESPSDPALLQKLRISWNLGVGAYPIPPKIMVKMVQGVAKFNFYKTLRPLYHYYRSSLVKELDKQTDLSTRTRKVHARFTTSTMSNSIAFQRKLLIDNSRNSDYLITGKISPKLYKAEMRQVAAVLSPFGWGEICFRDFETIINGSVLVKPDMESVDTWPNIYRKDETYIPIGWDGEDLADTLEGIMQNTTTYTPMVDRAKQVYKDSLLQMEHRVHDFLSEASGIAL